MSQRDKAFGNIILINANVRVCGNCGLAEPDAGPKCEDGEAHRWSY